MPSSKSHDVLHPLESIITETSQRQKRLAWVQAEQLRLSAEQKRLAEEKNRHVSAASVSLHRLTNTHVNLVDLSKTNYDHGALQQLVATLEAQADLGQPHKDRRSKKEDPRAKPKKLRETHQKPAPRESTRPKRYPAPIPDGFVPRADLIERLQALRPSLSRDQINSSLNNIACQHQEYPKAPHPRRGLTSKQAEYLEAHFLSKKRGRG